MSIFKNLVLWGTMDSPEFASLGYGSYCEERKTQIMTQLELCGQGHQVVAEIYVSNEVPADDLPYVLIVLLMAH